MSTELREAMVVGIELILFSLLIVIVAFFGRYSQDAFNVKTSQQEVRNSIETYSKIYEFTSGIEVDYELFEDKGMKRTTTGTYTNLTEANIISVYRSATNNNTLSTTNLPNFYLTTGDDIARFIGLFGSAYDVVVANLDNDDYHTLVFTDMDSANRKDEIFDDNKGDKIQLVKFSELSANVENMDNDNKLTVNYLRVNEYLGKEVGDKFYCVGVYDSAYNTYDSFVFYKIK